MKGKKGKQDTNNFVRDEKVGSLFISPFEIVIFFFSTGDPCSTVDDQSITFVWSLLLLAPL